MFNPYDAGGAIIISTMRLLSKHKAIERLRQLSAGFAKKIREEFEHRALPCSSCTTPGACCLDAHFVNVHISRLEAAAIAEKLDNLEEGRRADVVKRIDAAISDHGLTDKGDTYEQKFACPLYERRVGCLVHDDVKPAACSVHACYENEADLPPGELQKQQELKIDHLNVQTYGRHEPWLSIPVAIKRQLKG